MATAGREQLNIFAISMKDILASNLSRLRIQVESVAEGTTLPEERERANRVRAIINLVEHGRAGLEQRLSEAYEASVPSPTLVAKNPNAIELQRRADAAQVPSERELECEYMHVESMLTGDRDHDDEVLFDVDDRPEIHGPYFQGRSFYLDVLDNCWRIWNGDLQG